MKNELAKVAMAEIHTYRAHYQNARFKLLAMAVACFACTRLLFSQPAFAQEGAVMASRISVKEFFNAANKNNMKELVERFYAPDCEFEDPLVSLKGRDRILVHYLNLYENVDKIRFDFTTESTNGDEYFGEWTMSLNSSGLRGGETVVVKGVSHIRFVGNQAVYHRDYFDMGSMVYENTPVLGWLVRKVKSMMTPNFDTKP